VADSARRRDPREQTDAHRAAYTETRKALSDAIRAARANSWAELCRAVDNDPWGLPYRVVTKNISQKRPGVEARGREDVIVDHLFPEPPVTDWASEPLLTPVHDTRAARGVPPAPGGQSHGTRRHPERGLAPDLENRATSLPRRVQPVPLGEQIPRTVEDLQARKAERDRTNPSSLSRVSGRCACSTPRPSSSRDSCLQG